MSVNIYSPIHESIFEWLIHYWVTGGKRPEPILGSTEHH